jgi:hypothetical protein
MPSYPARAIASCRFGGMEEPCGLGDRVGRPPGEGHAWGAFIFEFIFLVTYPLPGAMAAVVRQVRERHPPCPLLNWGGRVPYSVCRTSFLMCRDDCFTLLRRGVGITFGSAYLFLTPITWAQKLKLALWSDPPPTV